MSYYPRIIEPFNYYTINPRLEELPKYAHCNQHTIKVAKASATGEVCIFHLGKIAIGDHLLSDLFYKYKAYIPKNRQEECLNAIFLKEDNWDPALLQETLTYLKRYIAKEPFNWGHYYRILDKKTGKYQMRVKVSVKRTIYYISTIHTVFVYTDWPEAGMHNEEAEMSRQVYNRLMRKVEWKSHWRKIRDKDIFKTDHTSLVFEQVYYRDQFLEMFKDLFVFCETAIKQNLLIKKDLQWNILDENIEATHTR